MGKAAPLVKGLDKMLEVDEDEKWRPTAPEEGSAVRRATVEGKHPEPDDFDEEAPLDLEELPPDLPRRTAGAKGRRKPSRSSSAPGPSSVEFGSALRRQRRLVAEEVAPGGRGGGGQRGVALHLRAEKRRTARAISSSSSRRTRRVADNFASFSLVAPMWPRSSCWARMNITRATVFFTAVFLSTFTLPPADDLPPISPTTFPSTSIFT